MNWVEKLLAPLRMGTTSYHHAKFGKIELRAPAVGAKFFFCHAPIRLAVRSTGCIVRTTIVSRFMDQF